MNRRAFTLLSIGLLADALAACSKKAPPEQQSQVFDSQARNLTGAGPQVIFTDVTKQAGIEFVHSRGQRSHQLPEDMGSGAAWGDYDNDGFPDLYLVNQPGPWGVQAGPDGPACVLYHNNRDGTSPTSPSGPAWPIGAATAWARRGAISITMDSLTCM